MVEAAPALQGSVPATAPGGASPNQDFITYVGDTVAPIFTVQNSSGVTVDISGAAQITWTCQRNLATAAALTKTKTGGAITFPATGTDGRFQVAISAADTANLSDWYQHFASIQDSTGNVTTVTVGRMQVGAAPNWTWVPSLVGIQPLYTVRRLIGDVIQSEQLLSDQEINWAVGEYSNEWLAAAECCRNISAGYSRQVDVVTGELKTNYSSRAKTYASLAIQLEQRGMARGGATAYAGGISKDDKINTVLNPDRVPPQFVIGMFDDTLPESPIGHQTGVGQSNNEVGP